MSAMSVGELSATVASLSAEVQRLRSDHESLLDTLKTQGVITRVKEAGWPGHDRRPRQAQPFSPTQSSQAFNFPHSRPSGIVTISPTAIRAPAAHKPQGATSLPGGGSNAHRSRGHPGLGSPTGQPGTPDRSARTMPGRSSMDEGPMRDRPGAPGNDLFSLARPLLEGAQGQTRLKALEQVRNALISGASPHDWRGEPSTPLIAAVKAADCDLAKMLLVAQADPHSVDEKGVTALHVAAYRGRTDLCSFMVEANADPNAVDRHGQTPLFFSDNVGVCRNLVGANADVNVINSKGQSALHLAARAGLSDVLGWLAARVHPQLPDLKDIHGATAAYYARHAGIREELARARPRKGNTNQLSPSSEAGGSPKQGSGPPVSKMESMATQLRNMTFVVEEEPPPKPASPTPSVGGTPRSSGESLERTREREGKEEKEQQELEQERERARERREGKEKDSATEEKEKEKEQEKEKEKKKERMNVKLDDKAPSEVGKQQSDAGKDKPAEPEEKLKAQWMRSPRLREGSPRLSDLEKKERKPPSKEQAVVRIQAAARGSIARKRYSQEFLERRTAKDLESQGRSTWKRKSRPLVQEPPDDGPSEVVRQESAPRRLWKGFKDAGHEVSKSNSSIKESSEEGPAGVSSQASEKVTKITSGQ